MRIDIHTATGRCHLWYDEAFQRRNAALLPDRQVQLWYYDTSAHKSELLRIVFQHKCIGSPRDRLPSSKEIELIETRGEDTTIVLHAFRPEVIVKGSPLFLQELSNGLRFAITTHLGEVPKITTPRAPVRLFDQCPPPMDENRVWCDDISTR